VSSRILIADNDQDARGLLAASLRDAGYACVTAETRDALSEARRQVPDAAIVGVAGPDDGGMWVVRALRAQQDAMGLVVVATPPNFDVASTVSRLGVVDCLPGPPAGDDVVDAVRRAVLWRHAVRAASAESVRLDDEVEAGHRHLKETIARVDPSSAQQVLLAVLEARTRETYDHVQRVARSAVALGRRLELAPAVLHTLRQAALLHDVGKIAIPDRILRGSGPLDAAELEILRSHVTIGAEVLASVPTLAPIAPIVAATHERFDGRGYPEGLSAGRIPLAARIVAVADAYDALTSTRSYRDSVGHDDANAELARCAGTHFDPDVVRAWIGVTEVVRCC